MNSLDGANDTCEPIRNDVYKIVKDSTYHQPIRWLKNVQNWQAIRIIVERVLMKGWNDHSLVGILLYRSIISIPDIEVYVSGRFICSTSSSSANRLIMVSAD